MVELPGGTFVIGNTKAEADAAGKEYEQYFLDQGKKETAKRARSWSNDEINDRPLTLPDFALARYPVTNAQYALFMADGGYDTEQPWWDEAARAWLQRDDATTKGLKSYQQREHKQQPEFWEHAQWGKSRPNHPVVGISWYEAIAFCRWITQHRGYNPEGYSYRLPTEAEWEYAARGTTRRLYPWGNAALDGERANYARIHAGTSAVGSFPSGATPEGIQDMAGNVWEWTGTVYQAYPYDPADGREDSSSPADKRFVHRGGGWYDPPIPLRPSYRYGNPPDVHFNLLGLRPARHRR